TAEVPERTRQIVRAGIVAIERARVADRGVHPEQVVHAALDLQSLEGEGTVPRDLYVVVNHRIQGAVHGGVECSRSVGASGEGNGCGGVAAHLVGGADEAQVPVHLYRADSPAQVRFGTPGWERAVVDFDSDGAL